MATPIIMPRQGQSVETCIITQWMKEKGEKIELGDLLFSYETDKAAFDEESNFAGTLLEVFYEEGDEVPVLTNVCVIGEEGENVEEFRPETATPGINDSLPPPAEILEKPKDYLQDRVAYEDKSPGSEHSQNIPSCTKKSIRIRSGCEWYLRVRSNGKSC